MKTKAIVLFLLPYLLIKHLKFVFDFGFVSFYNTIKTNFKLLDLEEALFFPIYITSNYRIKDLKGKVIIKNGVSKGLIQFGVFEIGIFNKYSDKGILDIKQGSTIIFEGNANFGVGCRFSLNKNSKLIFGKNVVITASTTIVCSKRISIGENCLFSWGNLFMDTDMHELIPKNLDKEGILIGDNVWIGSDVTLLKGTLVEEGCVIGSKSLVNRKFSSPKSLIAGNPARVIKSNIGWQ